MTGRDCISRLASASRDLICEKLRPSKFTFEAAGEYEFVDEFVDGPTGGALGTMTGVGVVKTRGMGVGTGLSVEVTTTFDDLELLSPLFDWARPKALSDRTIIEENANSFFIACSRSDTLNPCENLTVCRNGF